MTINRRHLLGSIAAATACTPIVSSAHAADATASKQASPKSRSSEGWLLARECRHQLTDHAVDFWERQFGDIAHTRHLPAEILRGTIYYDTFDKPDCQMSEAIDRSFQEHPFDREENPRRLAACSNSAGTLASTLRSLVKTEASDQIARTALLSLDSFGPLQEPPWAEVLPAFRACYERIIGHFHLGLRGLRQWRKSLNANFPAGYFQEFFTDAAAQCDAVVITSAGLCESDVRCDPYASTEELAGQLMHDLGCALLTPAVLDRIVGVGTTPRKPRLFALASTRLWTMDDYCIHHHVLFDRQRDLVAASFGNNVPAEETLLVATAVEDLHSHLVDEIRENASRSFFTTTISACEVEKSRPSHCNYLRMIRLWPFSLDSEESHTA